MRSLVGFIALALVLLTSSTLALAEARSESSKPSEISSEKAMTAAQTSEVAKSEKPNGTVVDAEAIRAHYAQVVAFTADVDQEKKAPFLARPLKSVAHLAMKDGRIEWKTISPVASSVTIDSEGIHLESSGTAPSGAAEAMKSAGKDPRAAAFIGFLRSLFALDFPGIERDFSLSFEGNVMGARPKSTSSLGTMIRRIDVAFSQDLSVQQVVVETKDETTTMNFRNFTAVTRP